MEKREMLECLINHFDDGNRAAFARRLGVNPQVVTNWLLRDGINQELCYEKLKGVSAHWLLSNGNGEMLQEFQKGMNESAMETENKYLKEKVAMLQEQIATLNRLVSALDKSVAPKKSNVV